MDRPVQTIVSQPAIVLKPLRLPEDVALPNQTPIRLVSDSGDTEATVVRKPAIPTSAPQPDKEPEAERTPPPPMLLNDAKLSEFAQESPPTIRGQVSGVRDSLGERPPLPQGPIADSSAIADQLTAPIVESTAQAQENNPAAEESKTKPLTNGALLIVTVGALGLLVYFIAIAFDYRQRWMESLTAQNNRLVPAFDDATFGFGYHDDSELYDAPRFRGFAE